MKLEPAAISVLSQDIPVALVSATNGKSTAATMLAAALSTAGPVAFNSGGSNMREGVAMALDAAPSTTQDALRAQRVAEDRADPSGWGGRVYGKAHRRSRPSLRRRSS